MRSPLLIISILLLKGLFGVFKYISDETFNQFINWLIDGNDRIQLLKMMRKKFTPILSYPVV